MYLNCVIICCQHCAGLFIVVDVVWREVVRTLISRGNSDDSTCWHCMCMRCRIVVLFSMLSLLRFASRRLICLLIGLEALECDIWCVVQCVRSFVPSRENFVSSLLATCYHAAWVVLCFRRAGCVSVQRMDNIVAVVWSTLVFVLPKSIVRILFVA